jgi:hypothetical protein
MLDWPFSRAETEPVSGKLQDSCSQLNPPFTMKNTIFYTMYKMRLHQSFFFKMNGKLLFGTTGWGRHPNSASKHGWGARKHPSKIAASSGILTVFGPFFDRCFSNLGADSEKFRGNYYFF